MCENPILRGLEIILRIVVALLKLNAMAALLKPRKSGNGQGIFHNSSNDRER